MVGLGARRGGRVSTDGGESWAEAELDEPPASRWAWRGWRATGTQLPASTCCAAGPGTRPATSQPHEAPWNVGGYANNAVQRVPVTVT